MLRGGWNPITRVELQTLTPHDIGQCVLRADKDLQEIMSAKTARRTEHMTHRQGGPSSRGPTECSRPAKKVRQGVVEPKARVNPAKSMEAAALRRGSAVGVPSTKVKS